MASNFVTSFRPRWASLKPEFNMSLASMGGGLSARLRRVIPEPFVFAILLTLLVAGCALIYTDNGPNEVLDNWYRGFWMLLEFSMQMVLMLTTGFAIALSPMVARGIDRLALIARTPGSVYVLVMVVGALFCLVSWGWVVLTAVLARELAKRVEGVDYAYLVACVYLSSQPWVGGLSSSIPLLLNTEGNFLITSGVVGGLIPVSVTLGSLLNVLYLTVFFISMPLLVWWLRPTATKARELGSLVDEEHSEQGSVAEEAQRACLNQPCLSDSLNNARLPQLLIALAALYFVGRHFANHGFDINLNIMIFAFIAIGLVAHQSPMRYVVAMKRACSNVSGIIFQYPFYAGIMGIMMFSGLGSMVSDWMAQGASLATLPLVAMLSGALVNFAIPSAGGEWAVIGPALTEAALGLSASLPEQQSQAYVARIAMAVAYGETATNLLQPFFLLSILPVMGAGVRIQARDVMGYLVLPFLWILSFTALLVSLTPL